MGLGKVTWMSYGLIRILCNKIVLWYRYESNVMTRCALLSITLPLHCSGASQSDMDTKHLTTAMRASARTPVRIHYPCVVGVSKTPPDI